VQVDIGFDYVLILEWLAGADARTGTQLHQFLASIDCKSELVVCHSWSDVEQALVAAVSSVPTRGVPVVHLETHGSDPWVGAAESIGLGPDEISGVAWSRLGALLAPLNVASDFRLLVTSAACWGSGVMASIGGGEHPAPFACAVGFRTSVREGRLRDCMKELYRSLKTDLHLTEAVASAQRELEDGQQLKLEIAVELAAKMLHQTYFKPVIVGIDPAGPHRRRRRAREVWSAWFPLHLQERNATYRFDNVKIDGWTVRKELGK
jgi:hypothetical protein